MNPIHLAIAPTFFASNDDRDAASFGQSPYLRLAKRWARPSPGASHLAAGFVLRQGQVGIFRLPVARQ